MRVKVYAEACKFRGQVAWVALYVVEPGTYDLLRGTFENDADPITHARKAALASLNKIYKDVDIEWTSEMPLEALIAASEEIKAVTRTIGVTQKVKRAKNRTDHGINTWTVDRPVRFGLQPVNPNRVVGKLKNTKGVLQRLIRRDGQTCCWCGVDVLVTQDKTPLRATIEHVTRLADGGTHAMTNLKVACMKCNTGRHVKVKPICTGALKVSTADSL